MAILIFIAVASLVLIPLGVLLAQGRREHRQVESKLARMRALPPSEARRLALERMRNGSDWRLKEAAGPASTALPPAVADILGEFEEVVCGEFWVGREALGQAARVDGFVKIGEDFELCELMVKPAGDEVYSSYSDAEPGEPPEVSPTVWHRILETTV